MHSLSLKFRITALALLVAILPLAISQFINADRTSSTLLQYFGNNLESRSVQLSQTLDDLVHRHMTNILTISKSVDLLNADSKMVSSYLSKVMASNPAIEVIAIMDRDAVIQVSTNKDERKHLLWEKYLGVRGLYLSSLEAQENTVFVSEANHSSGTPKFIILAPIFMSNDKRPSGVLLGRYKLHDIEKILTIFNDSDWPNMKTYVVDKTGGIILRSDTEISYTKKLKGVNQHPAMLSNNSHGIMIYEDENEIEMIAGYSDMREHGANKALDWSVVSISPVEDVVYSALETRNLMLIIGVILTALVTLVAYFFARGITLPLKRAALLAEEIYRGDYSHRLDASLGGEIGSLAIAINEMADRI